jgi:cold shock CspA family protein
VERLNGVVAVWLAARGFGFIVVERNVGRCVEVTKYFFHLSHITKNADRVAVGEKASFAVNPIREGKNLSAIDVEILDPAIASPIEGVQS